MMMAGYIMANLVGCILTEIAPAYGFGFQTKAVGIGPNHHFFHFYTRILPITGFTTTKIILCFTTTAILKIGWITLKQGGLAATFS